VPEYDLAAIVRVDATINSTASALRVTSLLTTATASPTVAKGSHATVVIRAHRRSICDVRGLRLQKRMKVRAHHPAEQPQIATERSRDQNAPILQGQRHVVKGAGVADSAMSLPSTVNREIDGLITAEST
jgi:hypothetical protein